MRVSTRILAGYSALLTLMVFGIGYELVVLNRVLAINERLSDVNYAGLEVTQLGEYLRFVDEFTEKYLVASEEYEAQLDDARRTFEETVASMAAVVRSEGERRALGQLQTTWLEFQVAFREARASRPPGGYRFLPARIQDLLRRMEETQIELVTDAVRDAFLADVALAEATRAPAWWVAWAAAVAAVGLASGVTLSMTRSIRDSFRKFMAATAAVAEGDFGERLPQRGRDEFDDLARSFNLMASRLEELDRLKKDFVSSVSHELKSPIASSREIVQLLLDEVPGPLNPEQRRLLELSVRSSRRLSAMVGGLLDLVRMDAGTMRYEMEPVDFTRLVSSAVEEFEVTARDRGIRIETNLEPISTVSCDHDRIVQVVGNLVDNAMKFSRRGSLVSIRLENVTDGCDPSRTSGAMFSIIDEGSGVADADKKRIFARFQQVRPEGTPQQGVGLGLAICRSIIEAHGGKIWVEDNPRGGSIFRFVLPSEGAGACPPPQGARSGMQMGKGYRIAGLLMLLLAVGGCGRGARVSAPVSGIFLEAESALRSGEYVRADRLYQEIIENRGGAEREVALARRALIYALPGTDIHDSDTARSILDQLVTEFPGTMMRTEIEAVLGTLPAIAALDRTNDDRLRQITVLESAASAAREERRLLTSFLDHAFPYNQEFDVELARADYRQLVRMFPRSQSRQVSERILLLISQLDRLDAEDRSREARVGELETEVGALREELDRLKEIDLGRRLPD